MKKTIRSIAKKTHKMSSSQTRLQRPGSTASLAFPKGLLNAPGENNCFLNSAVQVLWHLDVFRRSFRNYIGHACMGNSCIFCALKVIFTQFQYGEEQALPPDALRHALAENFKDQQRFQLGCMDDAAECFENILCRIHFHVAHDTKEDMCNVKHCVPHTKFGMTLLEHSKCSCGATSEPFPFTQMVNYVSCKALCSEYRKNKIRREPRNLTFGELLYHANAVGDIRECPSNCGKKIQIQRIVTNNPEVVSIGLVWDTDRPTVEHIMDVIKCLGTTIRLKNIFRKVKDAKTGSTPFILVGVVTYYGKHYSTFFYNTRFRMWIYFDDASVKTVGPNWRDVVERCRKGHYQPLLLIFADQNGRPVSMETAPKNTLLVSGPDSDDCSDADTSDGHEPEVFPSDVNPLPVNHNHYNSTSSSTSTQSFKSFTSFDSANTVIYKPSTDEARPFRTSSVNDGRPPKPARSNSSEMFRQIQPIPEFRPQVQSVDSNINYNGRSSRTAAANHNWGVVEVGHDAQKLITDPSEEYYRNEERRRLEEYANQKKERDHHKAVPDEVISNLRTENPPTSNMYTPKYSEGAVYPSEEYYRNEERRRLEEFANQKKERDHHKAVTDEMISNLRTENPPTSKMYTPKFPVSKDLIDFTQEEKTSQKAGESRRRSGEYDDQQTWLDGIDAPPVTTQKPYNLTTSTLGSRPRRQPSFQYAVGATSTLTSKPDQTRNSDVSQMRRPQSAMSRADHSSSQATFKDDYNVEGYRPASGRPQTAMSRSEPSSSQATFKDDYNVEGYRPASGRPQTAMSRSEPSSSQATFKDDYNVEGYRPASGRPQTAMSRSEPSSSQATFKDDYNVEGYRPASGRPQTAMSRSEPSSSQATFKDDYNVEGYRPTSGRPQSARTSQPQHKYSQRIPRNTGNEAGTLNHMSSRTQKPTEHRRSLVSSMSVPDLSEKLSQSSEKILMTNNGYREDTEVSRWPAQRRSQFGSQPHLNVDKPENYSSEKSSGRGENSVMSSKLATYRPVPTMQQTAHRTTSTNGYNLQNGFVTLPRKRQSTSSLQNVPMKADHVSDMVVKGNHPIAQKSDYYDRSQSSVREPQPVSATLTSGVLDQFHQTHLGYTGVLPPTIPKSDAHEVGSLGRDSGYRSGDRNSTSSGSIYSIDMLGDYPSSNGSPNYRTETHQHKSNYSMVEKAGGGAVYATKTSDTPTKKTWGDLVYEANKLIKKSRVAEDSDDLAAALSMITNSIVHIKLALKDSDLDPQTRILLENLYQSTISRSRSIHNCLQILQRQDSSHSSNADDDVSSGHHDQLSNQFQKMSLPHSKTFPSTTQPQDSERHLPSDSQQRYLQGAYKPQGSESFQTSKPQNRYNQGNVVPQPRYPTSDPEKRYNQGCGNSQVAQAYPTNPKQYMSTSLQEGQSAKRSYPQYSRGLTSESTRYNDYSQQPVKYSEPQYLYRAKSCVKGREMPQYASAATAPPHNPPTASLQRTHSEEFLDGHTGRRQSVKDKISMFESPQLNGSQTEVRGHYTAQDLYRPQSRSARDYPQEQTYKTESRPPIRRTQTMPSNAQTVVTMTMTSGLNPTPGGLLVDDRNERAPDNHTASAEERLVQLAKQNIDDFQSSPRLLTRFASSYCTLRRSRNQCT